MDEALLKAVEKVEANLTAMAEKAKGEFETMGITSKETKAALETLGVQQRELADRINEMEQKASRAPEKKADESIGAQVTKSSRYTDFVSGSTQKMRIEIKNTVVGSDTVVAPDRRPGLVSGAFEPLTMENFLNSVSTTSNAVEFTRELAFTNNAAEVSEGSQKPESALTFELVTMPISTVAHWIKISRQLAADAPALAAYINNRMIYGVNRKVETQLVVGNGTPPAISGIMDTGNYTAHGIANAALGSTFKKLVLIRQMITQVQAAGYNPDAILLNPADWATLDIEMLTTAGNQLRYDTGTIGRPRLFGLPVIVSVGMAADTVAVGEFRAAYTIYNREGTVVELSESDSDNFTKNLITVRAERRLALVTEVPAAVRGGDLTPV